MIYTPAEKHITIPKWHYEYLDTLYKRDFAITVAKVLTDNEGSVGQCPKCEEVLSNKYKEVNFCHKCGQRVYWEKK